MKSVKVLLSTVVVISLLASFTSGCKTTGTNQANSGATPGPTPVEEKYDLQGYEMKLGAWWDMTPLEENNPLYEDQMARYKAIEERYNVKIKFVFLDYSDMIKKFISSNLAGDSVADIWCLEASFVYPTAMFKGYLYPLNEYLDLSLPFWDQKVIELCTYQDNVYGVASNSRGSAQGNGAQMGFFFNTNGAQMGILFNKAIFERDNLPNLYELQKNKEWTWDKFVEIAKMATRDTNGDGTMDQWGFSGMMQQNAEPMYFVYSNGGTVTRKNTDGTEVFALDEENALEALDFYQSLFGMNIMDPGPAAWEWDYWLKQFYAGKTAMYHWGFWGNTDIKKNMTDQFGCVHFPMGPKATDYVAVNSWILTANIPSSVRYPKETSKILQDLCMPYANEPDARIVYEPNAYDDESIDTMIDMESKTLYTNVLTYPNMNGMLWGAGDVLKSGEKSARAWIEEIKSACQKEIDDIMAAAKTE